MRVILQILFTILVLLIKIEDCIRFICNNCYRLFRFLFRRKKIPKKSKHIAATFSLRTKIKYFSLGIFFSCFLFFLPIIILIFLQDLPSPKELTLRQSYQTTKILDKNGILLAQIYNTQNRTSVSLTDIPKHLQQATLAIEDKNFYKHPGFDISSIIRAISINLSGKSMQGGSTITQQLIKSSILTPQKSLSRKFKEVILAFWAERIYTKNQILEMYFNQVPYGGTAWGIEAAAQTYFNKSAKNLNLAQSSFLAGLTASPTTYSPYGNDPNLWQKRQKEVLSRMVALGFISQKQSLDAQKEKLIFKKQYTAIHAPHFVTYVKNLLAQKYGLPMLEKGGLSITTSLDLKTQEMSEKIVKEEVDSNAYLNLTNGAALITNPKNGDILAMIGSKDFDDPNDGNFNVATSLRQPGSSIKVVTYASALENGFTAASILEDTPVSYKTGTGIYSPVNYDGKFHGKVPLRIALANSFNIPAVKILNQIGVPAMVNLGKKMGISSWKDPENYGLSITLGAAEVTMLDMATVYGTLANDGNRVNLNPILKITDAGGNILEQKISAPPQPILEEGVAFILSDILADNKSRAMEFGVSSPLHIPGHTVSVKTGTTDNKRDNWTDGYTNNFVVIVWVGNNDNSPMSPNLASGITGAAPIWHKIMKNLLSKTPETKPTPPSVVVQKLCAKKIEYLLKRTENTPECKPLQTYSTHSLSN
ncbi:penicillin-binding protein [Patescibacteria group bacterium]|nr:penicillin-binding protein [Patescibacteria group bacterium]